PAVSDPWVCGGWVVGITMGRDIAERKRSRIQIFNRHVCASTPLSSCSGQYQTPGEIVPGYGCLEIWRRTCRTNRAAVCKRSQIYPAANQLGKSRLARVLDRRCSRRAASVCRNAEEQYPADPNSTGTRFRPRARSVHYKRFRRKIEFSGCE